MRQKFSNILIALIMLITTLAVSFSNIEAASSRYLNFDIRNSAGNKVLNSINPSNTTLKLKGNYITSLPAGTKVEVKYDVQSVKKSYVKSSKLISSYTQRSSDINRRKYFDKNITIGFGGSCSSNVCLDNSFSVYNVKVYITHKYVDGTEKVYIEHFRSLKINGKRDSFEKPVVDTHEPENPASRVEMEVYYKSRKLTKNYHTINYDDIINPQKLYIDGVVKSDEPNGTEFKVVYELTAYNDYSKDEDNLIKRYKQTVYTKDRLVKLNRDLYISTTTRSNAKKRLDNPDTIYLEDRTQYYTLSVIAYKVIGGKDVMYLRRDRTFLIKKDSEYIKEDNDPPRFRVPDKLSAYVKDKSGFKTEYNISIRDLNKSDEVGGIPVDISGFLRTSNWAGIGHLIDINYELEALDHYVHIKSNGQRQTIKLDEQQISPMKDWKNFDKNTQKGFLKRYKVTYDTRYNHERFIRELKFASKLEKGNLKDDSVLFFDNVARSYALKIRAKNAYNQVWTKNITINMVPDNQNTAPDFKEDSIIKPRRGTGYFWREEIPIVWYQAEDKEKDYVYYKLFYEYAVADSDGNWQDITKFIKRYDDMPPSENALNYNHEVETKAKVEPIWIKGIACDVNHACDPIPEYSQPFKLNEFGVNDGSQGKPGVTIQIYPHPTGEWSNLPIDIYVMDTGEKSLLEGVIKMYEVTDSSVFPDTLTKYLNREGHIKLEDNGIHYVHIEYELSDGTVITATAGPYLIDQDDIDDTGTFTMKLVDSRNREVTDWTNKDVELKMTELSKDMTSETKRQYRIEGYHSEWQDFEDGTMISVEGEKIIYGRIINEAGTFSEQQNITSKIDKTPAEVKEVKLALTEKGTYDVIVSTIDGMSGIDKLMMDNRNTLKQSSATTFIIEGLSDKPKNVTIFDKAGNLTNPITFAEMPGLKFPSTYNSKETVRDDVVASVSGSSGVLSYKLGNKEYSCTNSPCDVTISRNTLVSAIIKNGYKQTSVTKRVSNIDKSPLRLVLSGERDKVNEKRITLNWNHDVTSGKLTCNNGATNKTYTISGKSAVIAVQNVTYYCSLVAKVDNKDLASNTVTIYPDYNKDVPSIGTGVNGRDIDENVFVEESRIGTGYFINTRRDNPEIEEVPIAEDMFK